MYKTKEFVTKNRVMDTLINNWIEEMEKRGLFKIIDIKYSVCYDNDRNVFSGCIILYEIDI